MNDWLPLLKRARKTAITCVLLALVAAAVLTALIVVKNELTKRLKTQRDAVQQRTSELHTLTETRRLVAEGKPLFTQQQAQGLVGAPTREQWVQTLISLYHERGFTGTPEFKLHAPVQFAVAGPSVGTMTGGAAAPAGSPAGLPGAAMGAGTAAVPGAPVAPGAPGAAGGTSTPDQLPVVVRAYELEFKLSDAHEEDVLAILDGLQRAHPGLQQPRGCALEGAKASGLNARCQVNFFNVTRAAAGATASTTTAPGS